MKEQELSKRVDDLESRLTFMQVTIEELSGVVTRQQDALDIVQSALRSALVQLRGSALSKDNEPPPHY